MNYENLYWNLLSELKPRVANKFTSSLASCEFEVEPEFSFKEKYHFILELKKSCLEKGDTDTFSKKHIELHKADYIVPTELEEARFVKFLNSGGEITNDSLKRIFYRG